MQTLYVGNDNLLSWTNMKLASTQQYVNDATVTSVLKDSTGSTVASSSITWTYFTPGTYDGVLPSTVTLLVGQTYYLEVTAASGSATGFRRVECTAQYLADEG